jgi:hypothetical protein
VVDTGFAPEVGRHRGREVLAQGARIVAGHDPDVMARFTPHLAGAVCRLLQRDLGIDSDLNLHVASLDGSS